MKSFLVFAALLSLVYATEFQDCGSKGSHVKVLVEGCDQPPCVVKRGDQFLMAISFTPSHAIEVLTAKASAAIGGVTVPWPGFDEKACNYLSEGMTCPIPGEGAVMWEYPVDVLAEYPQISTMATFKLQDGDEDQACVQVPVTIV